MTREKLTVMLLTYNSASTLGGCLDSLAWVEDVLVLDGGSTDETVSIAKQYNCRVIEYPGKNFSFAEARNEGIRQSRFDWILWVDSDELVPPRLAHEVSEAIHSNKIMGYKLARLNYLSGRVMHSYDWYPNYSLRFFNKHAKPRFVGRVHEILTIDGDVGYLRSPLIHNPGQTLGRYLYRLISKYIPLEIMDLTQPISREKALADLIRFLFAGTRNFVSSIIKYRRTDSGIGAALCIINYLRLLILYSVVFVKGKRPIGIRVLP